MRYTGWILANLLILAPAAVAWWLEAGSGELYYRIIQEDHWMEWSTVWAFLIAAVAAGIGTRRQWRNGRRLPWFLAGLALFAFLVAMEEISWGQRLFNFTPPEYFLADNFQQELNVHNVIASDLRQLGFLVVVIGYGVLLPLIGLPRGVGRLFERIGLVPPPLALVPAFAVTAAFYDSYPLEFSGEWAELMLGLGMSIAIGCDALRGRGPASPGPAALAVILTGGAITLGFASMHATNFIHSRSESSMRAAGIEIQALRSDFEHERVRTRCGVHKRVYTFRVEYGQRYLSEGAFAKLKAGGLDDKRARFFLDPWNMPYWVRHRCENGREVQFVYSFGPNRRRDSTPWEILGDDIGAQIDATE